MSDSARCHGICQGRQLALKAEESSGRKAIIAAFLKHNGQAEWNATNFLGVISDIVAIKCKPSAPSWSAAGQNPLRQRWGLELAQAKAQPGQHVPAGHFADTSIVPRPSARSSSTAMKSTSLLALTLLSLSSCYSVGVPISDVSRDQSIGKTEHELEELFGMPHESSSDSDGVEVRSYGLRHIWGWSIDSEVFIDFTLIDGIVTKTRRRFLSHSIRNKGQH